VAGRRKNTVQNTLDENLEPNTSTYRFQLKKVLDEYAAWLRTVIYQTGPPGKSTLWAFGVLLNKIEANVQRAAQRALGFDMFGTQTGIYSNENCQLVYWDGGQEHLIGGTGGGTSPTGSVIMYGAATAPSGWKLCDGSAVSRTGDNAALFAILGTTYGVGDGSTTFNLPDFRSHSPIGYGQFSGLTNYALADTAGVESHPLVEAELAIHDHSMAHTHDMGHGHADNISATQPDHDHGIREVTSDTGSGAGVLAVNTVDTTWTSAAEAMVTEADGAEITINGGVTNMSGNTGASSASTTGNTGSGTAHETRHPVLTVNFIIKC
jgi:microcystin-dependent protein